MCVLKKSVKRAALEGVWGRSPQGLNKLKPSSIRNYNKKKERATHVLKKSGQARCACRGLGRIAPRSLSFNLLK